MQTEVKATLIVPDGSRPLAKQIVETLSSRAIGMFDTPMSPTGAFPATYWVSSGFVDGALIGLLTNPAQLTTICNARGLAVTVEQVTELLSVTLVDTLQDDPFAVFSIHNLTLCGE